MDETDFRILGHLFREPLASFEALGKAVGLTRNAVARRVRGLEESDVRLRWFGIPHPSLFGARAFLSLFGPHDRVDGAQILAVPGVVGFDHNYDGLVPVTYYQAEREPPLELVRLLGKPFASFDASGPGPRAPYLSRLEWKVVCACVENPRSALAELGRAAGLGSKTVGRHRARLMENGTLRIAATVQEGAADIPIFRAYIQGAPDVDALEKAVPGSMRLETTAEPAGEVRFCKVSTTAAVLGAVQRLHRVPGVDDVKVILTHQIEWNNQRILKWCRAMRDRNAVGL